MATIATNSQIKFKHGTQASLETLMTTNKSQIESGTFYLTRDTHRLYIGLSDQTLAPVNEGITKYTTATFPDASISNMGQFAYIEGTGILCISNGKEWFQINPDTNTTYSFDEVAQTVAAAEGQKSKSATITITVTGTTNKDKNDRPQSNKTSEEDIQFTFTGENGVIVEGNSKTITVYGSRIGYVVTDENHFTLQMKDKHGDVDSSVGFTTNSNLKVENTNGNIYLKAKDTTLSINDRTGGSALPTGFQIVAKDTDGNTSGGTIDPVIAFGSKNGQPSTQVHFNNGTATLNVYTKEEIDDLQLQFNAMNYKGVVDSLPVSDTIQNGDTYKASGNFTFKRLPTDTKNTEVFTGDVIIATGEEDENGYIKNPTWDVVPSGNEDTQYLLEEASHGIILKEKPLGKSAYQIGSLQVKPGTAITTSKSTSNVDGTHVSMTVNHADVSHTASTEDAIVNGTDNNTYDVSRKTFTTIVGLTVNEQGHVTGYASRNITMVNTNAKLVETMGVESKSTSNGAAITLTTTLDRSGDKTSNKATGTFTVKSTNDNLKISAGNSTEISMNFVWETFGTN